MYAGGYAAIQSELDHLEITKPSYVSQYGKDLTPPKPLKNAERKAIIGYSGFVGQNLLKQTNFTHLYRSNDIEEIMDEDFDMVVCAGLPADKWLANKDPEGDRRIVEVFLLNLES